MIRSKNLKEKKLPTISKSTKSNTLDRTSSECFMFYKGQNLLIKNRITDEYEPVTVITPGKKRTLVLTEGDVSIWSRNDRLLAKRGDKLGLI